MRTSVKRAPSKPLPEDNYVPTKKSLWNAMLELAKGERREYTLGGKTIHGPNEGRGFARWPNPMGVAWAVKQYNLLGGNWQPHGKYKEAATENVRKLEGLIKPMMENLRKLDSYWGQKMTPEQQDQTAKALGQAAATLYREAEFVFEDAARGKSLSKTKPMRRFQNFRKLIKDYAGVRNYEDAKAVIKEHRTKSKRAVEKLNEYAHEALLILKYFDSAVDDTFQFLNYTVTLVTGGTQEWDQDGVEKLKEVLTQTNRLLGKAGLGAGSGGRVFAFPGRTLPGAAKGSAGAAASYNIPTDTVRIAVGGSFRETLHSVVHELGHRVYFKALGGQGRKAWEQFFGDNVKPPDIDDILRRWEKWQETGDRWAEKYGRWLSYFLSHLKEKGDEDTVMWLNLVAEKADIKEDLNPMTGSPKSKSAIPGLDQLLAKKDEVKTFLYPVSAYSGKNAEELFAEVMAYMLVDGPGRVPEIVRDAFGRAVPNMRTANTDKVGDNTYENEAGVSDTLLKKYVTKMECIFASLRGWQRGALDGGVRVAFVSPRLVQGDVQYTEGCLRIKAVPSILKGGVDFDVVQALGRRYADKHKLPNNFMEPAWQVRSSSRENRFAELFALCHFKVQSNRDPAIIERFDALMRECYQ